MIKSNDALALIRTLCDANDDNFIIARSLMIDAHMHIDADQTRRELRDNFMLDNFDTLARLIATLFDDTPFNDATIESRTALALEFSLCPLHFIDYAICFDDDDADCAPIRAIHPSHDT